MALLSYADVSAIEYRSTDIGVRLTKEQQSFIIQAVALFNFSEYWSDYEDYSDTIDALVAASEYALQIPESYPPNMIQIDLFAHNAVTLAGIGTLTYTASATLPFGYAIFTANTTLHGMTQPCWLAAGDYEYEGWSSQSTNGGNTGVAITSGVTVIDTIIASLNQAGTFGTRVKSTGTFTVPDDGFYNVVAANIGSGASGRQANWISHHIKQVS